MPKHRSFSGDEQIKMNRMSLRGGSKVPINLAEVDIPFFAIDHQRLLYLNEALDKSCAVRPERGS
jgi:hypothetical protein